MTQGISPSHDHKLSNQSPHDWGGNLLQEVIEELRDVATVDMSPRMEHGRRMFVLLSLIS